MRKFMLAIALAAGLPLAACDATSVESEVLGDIQIGCGYVPDVGDITALIASYPPLTLASAIAAAFCQAVTTVPASAKFKAAGMAVVTVNGVPVHYAPVGTLAAAAFKKKSHWH
jgi:hypothetical protein